MGDWINGLGQQLAEGALDAVSRMLTGAIFLIPDFWTGFGLGAAVGLFVAFFWTRYGWPGLVVAVSAVSWFLPKALAALKRKPAEKAAAAPPPPPKKQKTLRDFFKPKD